MGFFSEHLATLGNELFPTSECQSIQFPSCASELVQWLAEGAIVLVPYDASGNHTPGLFQGAKAHWALLKGFVCLRDESFVLPSSAYQHQTEDWDVTFYPLEEKMVSSHPGDQF